LPRSTARSPSTESQHRVPARSPSTESQHGVPMFATLVGAYPRTALPGRPFKLRAAYGQLDRGEIDAPGFRAVQDELIREIVGEQESAGLEPITDGGIR